MTCCSVKLSGTLGVWPGLLKIFTQWQSSKIYTFILYCLANIKALQSHCCRSGRMALHSGRTYRTVSPFVAGISNSPNYPMLSTSNTHKEQKTSINNNIFLKQVTSVLSCNTVVLDLPDNLTLLSNSTQPCTVVELTGQSDTVVGIPNSPILLSNLSDSPTFHSADDRPTVVRS